MGRSVTPPRPLPHRGPLCGFQAWVPFRCLVVCCLPFPFWLSRKPRVTWRAACAAPLAHAAQRRGMAPQAQQDRDFMLHCHLPDPKILQIWVRSGRTCLDSMPGLAGQDSTPQESWGRGWALSVLVGSALTQVPHCLFLAGSPSLPLPSPRPRAAGQEGQWLLVSV